MPDSYPATLADPRANTTLTSDINATPREVDFVSRFSANWNALREIMNIINPVRKAPGTTIRSYKATVTLEDGEVPEGAVIPYSKAKVEPVAAKNITIKKYAKAVTLEDVDKYGARVAVQMTDDAFLNELQGEVLSGFYDFVQTGTLTSEESGFQMAFAMAVGMAVDKFKKLHRDASNVVAFVNTLDAYRYLGAAELTVQTLFGIQYIQNFMGASTVILSSELPRGKVIATAAGNIVLYYVDPADSEFAELGLNYVVDGETNLIGFHAEGNYSTAVGESFAIMGLLLWAEYLDAVAVVTIADNV